MTTTPNLGLNKPANGSANWDVPLNANEDILDGLFPSSKLALNKGGTGADLSGTGGTSKVLKQVSAGAAVTVAQLAASDLSNGVTGSGKVVLATNVLYVDPANQAGWAGADGGAWIAAAIAALPSTGGRIMLAPGTYTLSSTLTINRGNVWIQGAGGGTSGAPTNPGLTRLVYTGGAAAAIVLNEGSGPQFIKLTGFDLDNTGTGTVGIDCVQGNFYVFFDDVSVSTPIVPFSAAIVQLNVTSGFYTVNASIYFHQCVFNGAGVTPIGIHIGNNTYTCVVDGCSVVNSNTNIQVGDVASGSVVLFEFINGSDAEGWGTTYASFIDIDVVNLISGTISGSWFETAATATPNNLAIRVGSSVSNLAIRDNYMQGHGNANYHIQLNGGSNITIENNYFNGVVTAGINNVAVVSANTQGNYSSNGATIDSNAQVGIRLNGAAGTGRDITYMTSGLSRWIIRCSGDAETGSDAGSNLQWISRHDDGTPNSQIFNANRATGTVSFLGGGIVVGTPTGGGKGVGTINVATAYYANGTIGVTQTVGIPSTIATIGGIVTTLTVTSDERLKDAKPYEGGLGEILSIIPIRYKWNEKGQEIGGDGSREFVGFGAQNVQKAIPESIVGKQVAKDGTEYLGFDDRPIIAALVNAVKELQAEIELLRKAK